MYYIATCPVLNDDIALGLSRMILSYPETVLGPFHVACFGPVSQENLSPGNCVAATVFPQEIMSFTTNVATVYPKEILSSGNTVARHGSFRIRRTLLLAFCCNQTYILFFVIRTKVSVFEEEQNNVVVKFFTITKVLRNICMMICYGL